MDVMLRAEHETVINGSLKRIGDMGGVDMFRKRLLEERDVRESFAVPFGYYLGQRGVASDADPVTLVDAIVSIAQERLGRL